MSAVDTVRRENGGWMFSWGPNEYRVSINRSGHAVWVRWGDRAGFARRVDLTPCGDTAFRAALDRAAECAYSEHFGD